MDINEYHILYFGDFGKLWIPLLIHSILFFVSNNLNWNRIFQKNNNFYIEKFLYETKEQFLSFKINIYQQKKLSPTNNFF